MTERATLYFGMSDNAETQHEDVYGDTSWSDYRAGLNDVSHRVYGGGARNLRPGEKEDKPLRPMKRGESGERSFYERCYIFFRNYVNDVENGRIIVSDASYHQAIKYWEYYREKDDPGITETLRLARIPLGMQCMKDEWVL